MKNDQQWTVISLLQWTTDYLTGKGLENARLQAERMLCKILNCQRVELYLRFDRPLSTAELADFKLLLKRRTAGEPLQYILGETEFFSLRFRVGPDVLIPRPETEMLVQQVIAAADNYPVAILDIGTGSGNIAISLAKNLPDAKIAAIDISDAALKIARQNAELNSVADKIVFQRADICSVTVLEVGHEFQFIVANPPYISEPEYTELAGEIRNFEPAAALLAGQDGLKFYRILAERLPDFCAEKAQVFLEIGAGQGDSVPLLFQEHGFFNFRVLRDLTGNNRIVHMHYSKEWKHDQ